MTELDPNETNPEKLWAEIHRLRDESLTARGRPWREAYIERKVEVVRLRVLLRNSIFILTAGEVDHSDPDYSQ